MHNSVLDIIFIEDSGTITEPITLLEAKDWLKIDVSDEDALITALITTARQHCEGYLNISLIPRNVVAMLNNSLGGIYLPYSPVNEITSVQDYEEKEIFDYKVIGDKHKQIKCPEKDYLRVEYSAGYTTLPQHFKTALLITVAYLYEHRGDEHAGQFSPMAKGMLKPYRRV